MELAAKFGRPVLTFIDTPGAYPGIDAEERGQGEAIARNLREMARLPVPIIVTVTGEGGSGGALAIAVGDRVNILENGFYSVISPEGCASIIWRDSTKAETAAIAMKIMSTDLKELGIVDEIIAEPDGGAHSDHDAAAKIFGDHARAPAPHPLQPGHQGTPSRPLPKVPPHVPVLRPRRVIASPG